MLKRTRPRAPGQSIRLLARLLRLLGGAGGEREWARGGEAALSLASQLEGHPAARATTLGEQAAMLCGLLHELEPDAPPPSAQLAAEAPACSGSTRTRSATRSCMRWA